MGKSKADHRSCAKSRRHQASLQSVKCLILRWEYHLNMCNWIENNKAFSWMKQDKCLDVGQIFVHVDLHRWYRHIVLDVEILTLRISQRFMEHILDSWGRGRSLFIQRKIWHVCGMSLLSSNTPWIWCTEFENGNVDQLFPACTCLAGESLWLDAHFFSYLMTGATQTSGALAEAQGATRLVRWSAEKQRLTHARTVRSQDCFKEKLTLKNPQSSSHCMKMLTWKFCLCIASCYEWPFWICSNDSGSGLCRCSYHATVRVANLCWVGRCYWGPQPYNTDTLKARFIFFLIFWFPVIKRKIKKW